jgi:hypothetical protein
VDDEPSAWELQEAPPTPSPEDHADTVLTHDGQELKGKILAELREGFLMRVGASTRIILFGDIKDIQREGAQAIGLPDSGSPSPPSTAKPAPPLTTQPNALTRAERVAHVLNGAHYQERSRSVVAAYVLELLFPGAGLMYAGNLGEGVVHLLLVTLLPGLLAGLVASLTAGMFLATQDTRLLQLGLGLMINLAIILGAAVIGARVTSVIRAGPAAATNNQRVLGELLQQSRQVRSENSPEDGHADLPSVDEESETLAQDDP